MTRQINSKLKIPFELVYNQSEFLKGFANINSITLGKKSLYLTSNKGDFLKKCPGTSGYNCCDYYILHIGSFCSMDCSYCILQSYFHPPIMKLFVNYHKLENELNDILFSRSTFCQGRRIGTGEFSDSLIWDQLTDISRLLIEKFSRQKKMVLELKTKTSHVENFKKLKHDRKTIFAWSLNTSKIIKTEERNTASLSARLRAASKCESWGYPLAFHFDPVFIYEGCEKDYEEVIKLLFKSVSAKNIVWISIGSFRFTPSLKLVIQKRFPLSKTIYGEFVNGMDGKMRYFKPIRSELYKYIVKTIRKIAPNVCIYFCMEDDKIWKDSMGFNFEKNNNFGTILDKAAIEICNLE